LSRPKKTTFAILRFLIQDILGERVSVENGVVGNHLYQIDETAEVRIIRLQSVRVVMEDDIVMLYHNYENARLTFFSKYS